MYTANEESHDSAMLSKPAGEHSLPMDATVVTLDVAMSIRRMARLFASISMATSLVPSAHVPAELPVQSTLKYPGAHAAHNTQIPFESPLLHPTLYCPIVQAEQGEHPVSEYTVH